MKHRHLKKLIAAFIVFFLALVPVMYVNCGNARAKDEQVRYPDGNGEVFFSTDDKKINASMTFGFDGMTKVGRNIRTRTLLENSGDDFSGKLRIIFHMGAMDAAMVQRSFSLASGESKNLEIPFSFDQDEIVWFRAEIVDGGGKTIGGVPIRAQLESDTSQAYIGVLSKDASKLKYFNKNMASKNNREDIGRVFELAADDIPTDARLIDTLDVIVIDNFDTESLSEEQTDCIREWVEGGGTLFLGGGQGAAGTLEVFSKSMLNGVIGRPKNVMTDFGLREENKSASVEMTIADVKIEGAKSVLSDGHRTLASMVGRGDGNIIVSNFSLALGEGIPEAFKSTVVSTMFDNLSGFKKMQLSSGYSSYDNYHATAVQLNEVDALPNAALYAALLVAYALLAGPIAYVLLKKKDKRIMLWIEVPALAVLFSVIIYVIGGGTRVQKPYANYVSTIDVSSADASESGATTVFAIANSLNKPYSVDMGDKFNVAVRPDMEGAYYGSYKDAPNDYAYGVEYGADGAKLIMNKMNVFRSAYFETKGESGLKGTVDVKISKNDGKISGRVVNNMSCDLTDCVIYYDNDFIKIGEIKQGGVFDAESLGKESVYTFREHPDYENQVGSIFNGDLYDSSTSVGVKRKIGMLLSYTSNRASDFPFFYGFAKDGTKTAFTDTREFSAHGVTGIVKKIKVRETVDGFEAIGSLEDYAYEYNREYTTGYEASIKEDRGRMYDFKVKYKFPDGFKLRRILYNENTAAGEFALSEYNSYASEAFMGTAMVRDKKTGDMKKIIESGKKANVKNIADYLEKDGTLDIYYDIDLNAAYNGNYTIDSLTLPSVKIAGKYAP